MGYAAANHTRTSWAHWRQASRRLFSPVPDYVVQASHLTDPILIAWREANPRAKPPRWYQELCDFANANHGRAYLCYSMFVQQAEGVTSTAALLRLSRSAVKMAACNHPRGRWSGSVRTVAGEYDDGQIFICPDCGYKGA